MPLYPTGVSRIPLRKQVSGRSTLGPPDVYPQDPNQKEDELNAVHVKQGFTQSHSSLVSDEYGSMISKSVANEPAASAKVLADLKSIVSKKEDSNTYKDNKERRKQSINTRDNFWLVTQRNKPAVGKSFVFVLIPNYGHFVFVLIPKYGQFVFALIPKYAPVSKQIR